MSVTTENGKKWIQASVAVTSMLVAYIMMSFFAQLGEWFELESKIANFTAMAQVVGAVIGLGTFIYIMKNEKTSNFLYEVYNEILKVVWPGKDDTNKQTIVIMIGVTIIGFILGFFDVTATWALSLITK